MNLACILSVNTLKYSKQDLYKQNTKKIIIDQFDDKEAAELIFNRYCSDDSSVKIFKARFVQTEHLQDHHQS